jgi:predicted SAM-dependent methyltransferase
MKLITYNNKEYPYFQCEGNASQFSIPFAKHFCHGVGYDIGCMKKDWSLPGSIPIDISFDDEYHALNLPKKNVDFIYSSHCLEHVDDWVLVMDYWFSVLKDRGVLFLYLPDYSQEYWRPWNNKKHKHTFNYNMMYDYLLSKNEKNIKYENINNSRKR